jgi:hypothetical protein
LSIEIADCRLKLPIESVYRQFTSRQSPIANRNRQSAMAILNLQSIGRQSAIANRQ